MAPASDLRPHRKDLNSATESWCRCAAKANSEASANAVDGKTIGLYQKKQKWDGGASQACSYENRMIKCKADFVRGGDISITLHAPRTFRRYVAYSPYDLRSRKVPRIWVTDDLGEMVTGVPDVGGSNFLL